MSNGTELDAVQKLVSLCIRYANALERDSDYSELKNNKLRKIKELRHLASPDLNHFRATLAKPAYQKALSEHRTPELLRLVQYMMIVLTFPLSVPLLMMHSWCLRGTVDFSKSNGAALVEQLIALSDAEIGRQKQEKNIDSNHVPSRSEEGISTPCSSNVTSCLSGSVASSGWIPAETSGSNPERVRFFASRFTDTGIRDIYLRRAGEAIVIASRLRPFDYRSKEPIQAPFLYEF